MPLMIGKDPYWQQQQSERWSRAIASFMAIQERRRQQRERRFQDQLRILSEAPELASTDFGTQFATKWGEDYPEAPALVGAFRNKNALVEQAKSANLAFNQALANEQLLRSQKLQEVMQLPDQVQLPVTPPGGNMMGLPQPSVQAPGPRQQMLAAWQQQEPPEYTAFRMLPPEQQLALQTYWQATGKGGLQTDPRQIDPSKMPEKVRGVLGTGGSMGDAANAAQIVAGLEVSPAKVAERGWIDAAREDAQVAAAELEGLRNKNRVGLERVRQKDRLEAIDYRQGVQYGIDPATGKPNPTPSGSKGGGKSPVDELLGTASQRGNDNAEVLRSFSDSFVGEEASNYEYVGVDPKTGMPEVSASTGKGRPAVGMDESAAWTLMQEAADRVNRVVEEKGANLSSAKKMQYAKAAARQLFARYQYARQELGIADEAGAVEWAMSNQPAKRKSGG